MEGQISATTTARRVVETEVLIVGYGPVGVTAANFLGADGVDVTVLERDAEIYSRARAISTDEEVLRQWQRIGLAERLKEDMLGGRRIDFVDHRGRSFLELAPAARGHGHPSQMFLFQPALEEVLRDGAKRYANVDVRLRHEARQVRPLDSRVEVDVVDLSSGEEYTIHARWLLACDGGSSPTRTQLGIGFAGKTYEDPWVVVDVKVKEEWPEVDRLRFHCDPERPAVDCPTPLGHHRWEFPVFPWEDRDEVSSEESIWRLLNRYGITDRHVEILRRAVYLHHVRSAERWRSGRVFLLGDAAHCMPPWIGQGMGSGVRDAANLCWKLTAVLKGQARQSLLDSYEAERRPSVQETTDASVFFGRVITERRRTLIPLRNVSFKIAAKLPWLGSYLREGRWMPESGHGSAFSNQRRAGRHRQIGEMVRQPEVRCLPGGESVLLDELLGPGWCVLSRTERSLGAWEGIARLLVVGRDFEGGEKWLGESLRSADALILRPDRIIYAAVRVGEELPPLPAAFNLADRSTTATATEPTIGERLLAQAAGRLGDRALEWTFGQFPALSAVFREMARAFDPRVANGFCGAIQYDLQRQSGRVAHWHVQVHESHAEARRGVATDPKLKISIGLADFLRMGVGQLDQMDLMRARRVHLEGDALVGARLGPMFGRPKPPDLYVPPVSMAPPSPAAPAVHTATTSSPEDHTMNRTAPVCKLGHVQLSTPDIDTSIHFFRDLVGLDVVAEHDGRVYLRAWNEIDHHSLVLREGPTGVDHFALRASSAAHLEMLAGELRGHGVAVEEIAAGTELAQGDAIRFVSPQGHPWEVYWEMEKGRRDSKLLNQRGKAYLRGSSPMHLDHINIACVDPAAGEAFLADRLGFLRREFVQPTDGPVIASWMSVTSQIHDIAIALDPPPSLSDGRLHHISYIHQDRSDVLRAGEIMRDAGVTIDLAPGKHGISQAFFLYVKDPGSGHRVELFAGGMHVFDTDWEPIRWDETNIETGMVWVGPDFLPGSGGPMDPTTPCLPETGSDG